MASRRSDTDPVQSSEIRDFLYSQAGSFEESVNAAVIDAIGNLKDSIDREGEDILLQGLSNSIEDTPASASSGGGGGGSLNLWAQLLLAVFRIKASLKARRLTRSR